MQKKKRFGWILGFILSGLVIGFGIFAYILGKEVAHGFVYQNEGVNTHQNSLEQLAIWGYDSDAIDATYGVDYEALITDSGYAIPVMTLNDKADEAQRVVVLIHGLGGDAISTYPVAELYLEEDFKVVLYDQRASGRSLDNRVTFGYYEQEDLQQVVDWVYASDGIQDVTVHGISMGGTTLGLYLGSEHANAYVDYAVIDSAFHRLDHLFASIWNSMSTGIPERLAYYTGTLYMQQAFGFGFSDVNVLESLANTTVPTLLIHGEKDTLCPPEMAEAMAEALGVSLRGFWLNDSAHIESVLDNKVLYKDYIMQLLGDDFEAHLKSESQYRAATGDH